MGAGTALAASTAEERREEITYTAEVTEVGEPTRRTFVPEPVVRAPLLGVGEDLVGVGDGLESLFGLRVRAVGVGMKLAREADGRPS